MAYPPLKKSLSTLCDCDNIQTLDSAFKLILGVWSSLVNSEGKTIGDILGEAKNLSRPDIFGALCPDRNIPGWLTEKCSMFQHCIAFVQSGIVTVSYNGLEIRVIDAPDTPDDRLLADIDAAGTPEQFLQILVDLTKKSLTQA
ncbi:hypothetical protein UA45_13385 [Morganella morganii]|uniref:Uncharacterized protein n=1 Tax=Morganella morganii TaxID=582 RepID=A0A0D8L978_MORMO|nr:hypothetical protein UA45_13385 [Morganella morganii]